MGKRIAESREEVDLSSADLQYFGDNAEPLVVSKKSAQSWETRI
jgi:hypothetical protein